MPLDAKDCQVCDECFSKRIHFRFYASRMVLYEGEQSQSLKSVDPHDFMISEINLIDLVWNLVNAFQKKTFVLRLH